MTKYFIQSLSYSPTKVSSMPILIRINWCFFMLHMCSAEYLQRFFLPWCINMQSFTCQALPCNKRYNTLQYKSLYYMALKQTWNYITLQNITYDSNTNFALNHMSKYITLQKIILDYNKKHCTGFELTIYKWQIIQYFILDTLPWSLCYFIYIYFFNLHIVI